MVMTFECDVEALQPEVVRSEMGGTGDLEDTMQPWASPRVCPSSDVLLCDIMNLLSGWFEPAVLSVTCSLKHP